MVHCGKVAAVIESPFPYTRNRIPIAVVSDGRRNVHAAGIFLSFRKATDTVNDVVDVIS